MILGLVQGIKENYYVLKLWNLLKLNNIPNFTIVSDLKFANILIVIRGHSSSYSCTWCNVHKDLLEICGTYRTLASCIRNYNSWKTSGGKKEDAKLYRNKDTPFISTWLWTFWFWCEKCSVKLVEKCNFQKQITYSGFCWESLQEITTLPCAVIHSIMYLSQKLSFIKQTDTYRVDMAEY